MAGFEVEKLRLQSTGSASYFDVVNQDAYFRTGSGGTTKRMMITNTGSVLFGNDIPNNPLIDFDTSDGNADFVGGDVRVGITGTGANERGTFQLVTQDTLASSLNVFYVTRAGASTCTISSGGDATFAGTINNGTTVGTSDQRFKENILLVLNLRT